MKFEHSITVADPAHALFICTRLQMAVKTVATPGVQILFRNPEDARFEAAIAFGMEWTAQRFTLAGNRLGLEATVFFVEREHLGPKLAIVAMLAALCGCDALGLPDEPRPRFDESQRIVIFPL